MIAALGLLADADGLDHMSGWDGGWMWLWGVVAMVLFVVLIVWLVRASVGPATRVPADRARDILAERYAKGELTTQEYRERVSELR